MMSRGIDALPREKLIDLIDNTLGVGCTDERSTDDLRAEAQEAYAAGKITDLDVNNAR